MLLLPSMNTIFYPISNYSRRIILLAIVLTSNELAARAQSFAPVVTYSAGNFVAPLDVTLSDVNRDGNADIITANGSANAAGVLLNNGNGAFRSVVQYSTGGSSFPQSVSAGDLNGDGFPDIVTANYIANSVSVLLNSGNGTFQSAVAYPTGSASAPYAVTTGDINADGKLDIVTANYNNNTVGLLQGNGNGTFQPIVTYSAGPATSPQSVAVADVNGDGQPDVVTGNYFGNSAGVLLNDGFGSFQPIVLYTTGSNHTHRAVVFDVNSDNNPDIVVASFNNNSAGILLGNGNGTFQGVVSYPIGPNQYSYGVAVADVNSDAKADLIAINGNSNAAQVLLGNGNGTFQPYRSFSTGAGTAPIAVAVADLNSDGKPDIVSANNSTNAVSVLLNNSGTVSANRSRQALSDVQVYPTRATAHVTVRLSTARKLNAVLLEELGRPVRQYELLQQTNTIATDGLPRGLYLLRLAGQEGARTVRVMLE